MALLQNLRGVYGNPYWGLPETPHGNFAQYKYL